MRTTLNISDTVIKEAEAVYKAKSKSEMVENALKDAVRFKKIQQLMNLKGNIEFDEETIKRIRSAEINETNNSR
ncbi:MAG: type II toxin-antitoxin system VapB family antitoxin [Halanaerobiales bacterium]